ncbi:MAG: fibronectin type III domain-containing protein [Gammaproteobacteria bacterium]|nr:fibronectin type III domain-containing protein [Gammaproteobacteria bacterium]
MQNSKFPFILLTAQIVLSGCGGSDESETTSANSSPSSPATTPAPSQSLPPFTSAITLTTVDAQKVGSSDFASSTQLQASWQPPTTATALKLQVVENGNSHTVGPFAATTASYTLTNLKAATPYQVTLLGCQESSCSSTTAATDLATAQTSEEFWQIQGGNSYETATQAVDNGSTLSYTYRYEEAAGSSYAGRSIYYFNPARTATLSGGMRIALSDSSASDVAALSHFTLTEGGLVNPCSDGNGPDDTKCNTPDYPYVIQAFQAVPLTSGFVKLFFEAHSAMDADSTSRIYTLDSQDGYVGIDFDKDLDSSLCEGSDFAAGGSCELTLAIGADGDQPADSGLKHARQFKIGYPMLDSSIWDEAAGTFMVITAADSCEQTQNGLFLAHYEGNNQWQVAQESGCAKMLVRYAHGPVITYLGDGRYKVYYEYETDSQGNMSREEKPLRMIYVDSGSDNRADIDEFEAEEIARNVNFLWADGTLLSKEEEMGLGDHVILTPSKDLQKQYMYMNLGGMDNQLWRKASAGLGMAVLLNP